MPAAPPDDRQPTPLTREIVLSAALDIIDSQGVDGLTMRRLGQALDRDPMALYRYAANKNALLDGVVELVMGQARLDPSDPDWAGQCAPSPATSAPSPSPIRMWFR